MRLTTEQITIIKSTIASIVPAKDLCGIRLYGSRIDDSKRGGDIDLMLQLTQPACNPANLRAAVSSQIERQFERAFGASPKVDILLLAPNLKTLPIHQVAIAQGLAL